MKKTLLLAALVGVASVGYSQGLVSILNNSATYAVSTNGVGAFTGGTLGKTFGVGVDTGGQSYDYVLLYSSSPFSALTLGASSTSVQALSIGPTAVNGTGPGTINGSSSASLGAAATTYYVELAGWSTGLGTSFSSIESILEAGDTTIPGQYIGFSNVGQVTTATSPAPGTTIYGTAITSGFDLNYVPVVPEPTTLALSALGGLSLLALRRKKS